MQNIKDIRDSFQAFLVDGAEFTEQEEYPILREDMVPDTPPKKILPFSRAITYKGDLSKTYICFFSLDDTFERVRRNPKKYLNFFKRTAGIIGFDFSVHSDMPLVKQKAQMNDNLSLCFYFANHGIPLIPAPRCGAEVLEEEYLKAFPKNSYIALGVHGFIKYQWQKAEWYCWIDSLIKTLHPKGFIVIGHLSSPIFDDFKDKAEFLFYDSFIEERWREASRDVNQRAEQ